MFFHALINQSFMCHMLINNNDDAGFGLRDNIGFMKLAGRSIISPAAIWFMVSSERWRMAKA
jgi:hypothetical protein